MRTPFIMLLLLLSFPTFVSSFTQCPTSGGRHFSSMLASSGILDVDGIQCRPILIDELNITVVEATAQQQDILVDWALENTIPSGDPYGAVVWPAARTLAQRLVFHKGVQGKTIWEIGSGTGLVSMAVAQAGALRVHSTDYEAIPLKLLSYAAGKFMDNATAASLIETSHWDVCNCDDKELPTDVDIMVAADLLYEPVTGVALANLVVRALQAGMEVLIADSPGRAGRPAFLKALQPHMKLEVDFVHVNGTTVTGERNELICGKSSMSVSATEQPLSIALLELRPSNLKQRLA